MITITKYNNIHKKCDHLQDHTGQETYDALYPPRNCTSKELLPYKNGDPFDVMILKRRHNICRNSSLTHKYDKKYLQSPKMSTFIENVATFN